MKVEYFAYCKIIPFQHQIVGTKALIDNKSFALFDEPGAGKSKQVVDAACALAERGEIDTVVVVAPASVRCVWLDAEIGEIKKHSWMPNHVIEFHSKLRGVWHDVTIGKTNPHAPILKWVITNYEFLRQEKHLVDLCTQLLGCKVLLVLDESSYIKNRTATQTRAVAKLRKHCARCVLLNGTPVTNSPLDLWSQMQVLDRRILGAAFNDNFYHFRAEYCDLATQYLGKRHFQKVSGYRRLDKLAGQVAPYVLRREKKDCLDLPEKLYTEREVALTAASWKRYQELKEDALVTLGNGEKRLEPNAAVRIMRLAQLTSGHLGTIIGADQIPFDSDGDDRGIGEYGWQSISDLSDEKLRWAIEYLTEECTAKAVIVWCRWRRERERLFAYLQGHSVYVYELYGGQQKNHRESAIKCFSSPDPEFPRNKCVLIAQPHAGGHGLNLVAASEAIYLSNDFSLGIRLQSEDRCHRPGQVNKVLYTDVLATGPAGQKTIDHVIFKALRAKRSVADFTTAEWRKELSDES